MTSSQPRLTLDQIKDRATIDAYEFANLFAMDHDSALKAMRNGEVPAFKVGRLWRVPVPKLLAMLGCAEAEPAQEAA